MHLLKMRRNSLVVPSVCLFLVAIKLRLKILVPLLLAVQSSLLNSWGSIKRSIVVGGQQYMVLGRVVVGPGQLQVWFSIRLVVWRQMRGSSSLELQPRDADARCCLIARLEVGWAPENDGQNGIPCRQPVRRQSRWLALGENCECDRMRSQQNKPCSGI